MKITLFFWAKLASAELTERMERTKSFTPVTNKTKPPFSCSGTLLSAACHWEMDGKAPDTSSWCGCCYGNMSRAGHCTPRNLWLGAVSPPACFILFHTASSSCVGRGSPAKDRRVAPSTYFLCLSALTSPAIELKAKMRQRFCTRWFCFCLHKVNKYPSKQFSPPCNLSFFSRLNSQDMFSTYFLFLLQARRCVCVVASLVHFPFPLLPYWHT